MLVNTEDKIDLLIEEGYYHDENMEFFKIGRTYNKGERGESMESLYKKIIKKYEQ